MLILSARTMPTLLHRYKISFALTISVFSVLLSMSLSADNAAPPLHRIIAYVCLNPKCNQSFTNLHSYDQHRTHARNANTLCASLTMRREIVATRRAGVTTSVLKEVAPRGDQRMRSHSPMTMAFYEKSIRKKQRILEQVQRLPNSSYG